MTFTQMYDTLDTAVTNISNNILLMPLGFKLSLAQNQTGKKIKGLDRNLCYTNHPRE